MSEMNPGQAMDTGAVASPVTSQRDFIAAGREVDTANGWTWIQSGFDLFKKQPGSWILIVVLLLVCWMLLALVPVIGGLAGMLLYPVFIGGILLGASTLDKGGTLEVAHLFAGFKQNTSPLVVLGVFAVLLWIITFIPAMLVGGAGFWAAMHGDPAALAGVGLSFMLAILILLALSVLVYMALWFAPALIVFHNLAPVDAMKTSFSACAKNLLAFLLYSVIILALSIAAAIPFGLGFLVLMPLVLASIYTAYKDIFFAA